MGSGPPLGVLSGISTPLRADAWEEALRGHPDRLYAGYILRGLREGFRIGANRGLCIRPAYRNLPSALQHPRVVSEYLSNEAELGRMLGPFQPGTLEGPSIQINRMGVIPKGHSGKWRVISDLSHPPGHSVNDAIDPELCSLTYTTVEKVAQRVMCLGRGALMAKVDIEAAYRLVPVHPQDRPLCGIFWEGSIFVDPVLPFGLRSAPKIFNAIADAIEWQLKQRGVEHVSHYLDDFIVWGPPASPRCQEALDKMVEHCARLGVPLARHKTVGPTSSLTFLGITVDTEANELRLPEDKLTRLKTLLTEWGDRKACSRRELESLVGTLNHACKVVRPGRAFLRRMLNLLKSPHAQSTRRGAARQIRLNRDFRSDLLWWRVFAERWNGVSVATPLPGNPPTQLTTDASGTWGCGAWSNSAWFQLKWDNRSQQFPIVVKELIPIIIAAAVWGERWRGQLVCCRCDNQAVVAALNARSCRESHIMHMLRCLYFIEAHFQCDLRAEYISSQDNSIADDLSRNNIVSFHSKMLQADRNPTAIPPSLPPLLFDPHMDWVSPTWTQQFRSILYRA